MSDIDPLKLDRDIASAAWAERRWCRTLRADPARAADDAWYEPVRYVTTRATFVEVSSMKEGDPLRQPLRRWIHRLAVTRIALAPALAAANARHEAAIRLEKPEPGSYSVRAIVQHALFEREPGRAAAWLEGLGSAGSSLFSAERRLREAKEEITARLGISDPGELLPYDRQTLRNECEELLRATDDLASAFLRPHERLAPLIAKLVARDVPGVWPSRADGRWLHEQFQGTPLIEGLSLDLGPVKAPLGGSTFARALSRFGASYARSAVLGAGPFVMQSDASEVHPLRRGALFGSLVADPIFLRKKLMLSREAADKAARSLGATLLAEVRLDAVRAVVDFDRLSSTDTAEAVTRALGVPIPAAWMGALPRLSPRARERTLAALLASDDASALRAHYDEDWFKNPRALLNLRERDAAPLPLGIAREALAGSAERLSRALIALVS